MYDLNSLQQFTNKILILLKYIKLYVSMHKSSAFLHSSLVICINLLVHSSSQKWSFSYLNFHMMKHVHFCYVTNHYTSYVISLLYQLRWLGILPSCSAIFIQGEQLLCLPVCLPRWRNPSKEGPTLKEKLKSHMGANFFHL